MIGRGLEGGFGGFPHGPGAGLGRHAPFLPGTGIGVLVALAVLGLVVIAFWQIYKKAGYEGGLGLLMLIPFVNLGAMLFLAFSDWPALKELREQRGTAPSEMPEESPTEPAQQSKESAEESD